MPIPCHITIDQGKTIELELDMAKVKERRHEENGEDKEFDEEFNMEEETEQYYKVEEELVSVESQKYGVNRIRSSDGHTFRVEHDATKRCVNILFDGEEELYEFNMSQCMKHTMFQSTETSIIEVKKDGASKQDTIMVGEEETVTKKAAKRACQRTVKRTTSAT